MFFRAKCILVGFSSKVNVCHRLHLHSFTWFHGFVFPGKTSDRWKHGSEKVCVLTGPGAALSIPGSLATRKQEQQPLALSKGTFLHPALLGCRTMTELHTYTHAHNVTAGLDIFCVFSYKLAHSRLSPYSLPVFRVVSPFCTWPLITKKLWYWKWNWGQWGVKSKKVAEKEVLDRCYMQCDPLVVFFGVRWDSPSLRCPVFLSHSALACLFLSHPPIPLFR